MTGKLGKLDYSKTTIDALAIYAAMTGGGK